VDSFAALDLADVLVVLAAVLVVLAFDVVAFEVVVF